MRVGLREHAFDDKAHKALAMSTARRANGDPFQLCNPLRRGPTAQDREADATIVVPRDKIGVMAIHQRGLMYFAFPSADQRLVASQALCGHDVIEIIGGSRHDANGRFSLLRKLCNSKSPESL
jgi:hypothetical protein